MAYHHSPRIITDGLVLVLDAANQKSYPGSGTTWSDLSGNGNNGTLINGPTFDSGNLGSISFDGVNDYINCGNGTSINVGMGSITISVWYKRFTNATTNLRLLAKGAGSDGAVGFAFFGSNTAMQFIVTDGPNPRKSIGTSGLFVDTWYNVVGIIDRSINTSSIYYNGEFKTSRSDLTPTTLTSSTILYIGANVPGSVLWDGVVSQVQIYTRALSPEEIPQNYNET